MDRVLDVVWWGGGTGTVGAVAIKCGTDWKGYIGQAAALESEQFDIERILDYGAKLSEKVARAIFPKIQEDYGV